ncbi:MAG: lytic murein transglycosylase [Bdellovibrionales bacterium]|nr:lytic murein transglycosylase [Bdellovibrionales bacterium]
MLIRRFILKMLCGLLICSQVGCNALVADAKNRSDDEPRAAWRPLGMGQNSFARIDIRGWDYLVDRLVEYGLSRDLLHDIYSDKRMPQFSPISFKLEPSEAPQIYQGTITPLRIRKAQAFLETYRRAFERAEGTHGVDRRVISAILLLETEFGANTGNNLAIYRLSRLAGIATPSNVDWNYERLKREHPGLSLERVQARAKYIEALFLPEIEALLQVAKLNGLSPFGIKGSRAGAFGIPQFLPSSYLKYAVDGNADGRISLYQVEDAINSVANFLAKSGWKEKSEPEEKQQAIWQYNRSKPYVETIVNTATKLGYKF